MKKYRHIFFDLDRTLWDFDRNSSEALTELFYKFRLDHSIDQPAQLIRTYHEINLELWARYREGELTKEILRYRRFRMSFDRFGIRDEKLAEAFGEEYLHLISTKTILVPHAREILDYLQGRYLLHILTNGFLRTQQEKLRNCRMEHYFESMTTSEDVGHNKPRAEIFQHALSSVHARKTESLMVGDDLEVDIMGARSFGIDQVFLNRDEVSHRADITFEIQALDELREIL